MIDHARVMAAGAILHRAGGMAGPWHQRDARESVDVRLRVVVPVDVSEIVLRRDRRLVIEHIDRITLRREIGQVPAVGAARWGAQVLQFLGQSDHARFGADRPSGHVLLDRFAKQDAVCGAVSLEGVDTMSRAGEKPAVGMLSFRVVLRHRRPRAGHQQTAQMRGPHRLIVGDRFRFCFRIDVSCTFEGGAMELVDVQGQGVARALGLVQRPTRRIPQPLVVRSNVRQDEHAPTPTDALHVGHSTGGGILQYHA